MKRGLRTMLLGMAAILGGYCYMIKRNTKRKKWAEPYETTYIAHRGYFDVNKGIPENSLPAFQRAVEKGYGIELDVQLTKDKQLVVFHDETLTRMCGVDKKVRDCTYKELQQFRLQGSKETIPLFTEVQKIVTSDTPWIIEVKPEGDYIGCVEKLLTYMKDYKGLYVVESFHPAVLHWLRRHEPQVIRGQLSSNMFRQKIMKQGFFAKFALTNLLTNFWAKPDFIAYNHEYVAQPSYRFCRKLYHAKHAAWTLRSEKELEKAEKNFSIFIFDSFEPKD